MRVTAFIFFFLLSLQLAKAGDNTAARLRYIEEHKDDAIREMQESGIPASITMAQACLESSDGLSPLAVNANNHFGIKCADWSGPSYTQDDDKKDECFRKYNHALESYDDHSNFLKTRPRYAFLFELDKTDYKGWAKGLKKAGYATDPHYADRLIKIIEDYQLFLLDQNQPIPLLADTQPTPPSAVNTTASTSNEPILTQEPVYENRDVKPTRNSHKIFVPSVDVVDAFGRKVHENNGVKYVIARRGDTYHELAQELNMGYWQLPKYNETDEDSPIREGQYIYLQPKKKEGNTDYYIVKAGDTIQSISNQTAVKESSIRKFNHLDKDAGVAVGQKIMLRK
ncbi:MAG: glucosaminidase domain-containing protein [Bacteroidia bacterium]